MQRLDIQTTTKTWLARAERINIHRGAEFGDREALVTLGSTVCGGLITCNFRRSETSRSAGIVPQKKICPTDVKTHERRKDASTRVRAWFKCDISLRDDSYRYLAAYFTAEVRNKFSRRNIRSFVPCRRKTKVVELLHESAQAEKKKLSPWIPVLFPVAVTWRLWAKSRDESPTQESRGRAFVVRSFGA
jgi:hypothetical protein